MRLFGSQSDPESYEQVSKEIKNRNIQRKKFVKMKLE